MIFFVLLKCLKASNTTCPVYQCANLPENICMTWSNNIIKLNNNGCSSKYICLLSKALIEYALNPDSGFYSCESNANFSYAGYNHCGKKNKYKRNLKSGTFPKECSTAGYSDFECLLEDGSYLECRCGLQSKLFCSPNPDSYVFDDFWDECSSNDNVVSARYFDYYQTLYQNYVEFNTAVNCSQVLFAELSKLKGAVPSSGSGSVILFVLVGWVLM